MKHLLIVQTLLKAVPESLFRLTDFAVGALEGLFSKPDMTVNIRSSSSAAYQKGFHINNRLTETWYKLSVSGFSKVLHN